MFSEPFIRWMFQMGMRLFKARAFKSVKE